MSRSRKRKLTRKQRKQGLVQKKLDSHISINDVSRETSHNSHSSSIQSPENEDNLSSLLEDEKNRTLEQHVSRLRYGIVLTLFLTVLFCSAIAGIHYYNTAYQNFLEPVGNELLTVFHIKL